jgi:hypothetical protein
MNKQKFLNKVNRETFELLNFEGPVLSARIIDLDHIEIYDEFKVRIEILKLDEFLKFIEGRINLEDSKGKIWNFRDQDFGARITLLEIFKKLSCHFLDRYGS